MWPIYWVLWANFVSGWPQFDKTLSDLGHFHSKPLDRQESTPAKNEDKKELNGLERASRYLLDSIDQKIDPCTDFYNHACGGWKTRNKIPESQSSISHYSQMQKKVLTQIQDILAQPHKNDTKSSAIDKARLAYKACLNREQLNKIGTSELRKELERLGGWPLVDLGGETESQFDLTALLLKIYKERAKESLISVSKTINLSNSTQYLLNFRVKSQLLGAPEYYLDESYSKIIDTFEKILQKMATIIAEDAGLSVNEEFLKLGVKEIVDFDRQIAQIKYTSAQKSSIYHEILDLNVSKLQLVFPAIDWDRYWEEVWPTDMRSYLDEDPEVYIESPDEFFELTKILLTTEPRIIVNYVLMAYVYSRPATLDSRFDKLVLELAAVVSGTNSLKPRDEICTVYTWSLFPLVLDLLYIRNYFGLDTKQRVEEMVTQMRGIFDELIQENEWMDNKTKDYASKKLEKLNVFVGYSPLMNDSARIDTLYQDLELESADSFDRIMFKINKFGFNRHFHKLLQEASAESSALDASEVNAEYNFRNFAT